MSERHSSKFDLPRQLEKLLAALSVYFGKHGRSTLQRLVVNSTYRVHEEWDYDNWNGGQYGHAVFFEVPSPIYYDVFEDLAEVSDEICQGLNRFAKVPQESFSAVFIELKDDAGLESWREQSGVLAHPTPSAAMISEEQLHRIWTPKSLRVFLSHKVSHKKLAAALKDDLADMGVSCFVAHESIKPTKAWQSEIERALFTMHVLVALMTENFPDSEWTDQEVGVAIGRQVPVVSVKLGTDPYGFIGKYQALNGFKKTPSELADELYDLFWEDPQLKPRAIDALVSRFEAAENYNKANRLMKQLLRIENVPPEIVQRLETAPKHNVQVREAFEVRRHLPGLLTRLQRK